MCELIEEGVELANTERHPTLPHYTLSIPAIQAIAAADIIRELGRPPNGKVLDRFDNL